MNKNCVCPRIKCKRHGSCSECRGFHGDPDGVMSFCQWAEIAGFTGYEPRAGLKAWLSNDRTPFDMSKWNGRRA